MGMRYTGIDKNISCPFLSGGTHQKKNLNTPLDNLNTL
jgi:hypothetical protein